MSAFSSQVRDPEEGLDHHLLITLWCQENNNRLQWKFSRHHAEVKVFSNNSTVHLYLVGADGKDQEEAKKIAEKRLYFLIRS